MQPAASLFRGLLRAAGAARAMRSARSADALLLQPAPPAPSARLRARPPVLATACDAVAAAAGDQPTQAFEARARSPVAWGTPSKPVAGVAATSVASLLPAAAEGASRNLTADGELDEVMMQRNASNASLAPSAASDESDGGDDWEADTTADAGTSAWPTASACRGRARVALSSPRSAPIAVHRPPRPAGSVIPHNAFSWRSRAPDAAADALSGGAFMPPQWRGDAVDGDGDDSSPPSSSLPPLRALALRDCILRRTGFIEKDESPPAASAQLPGRD